MGLIVSIYRDGYDSPANRFFGKRRVTVTNIDGPFEPTDDEPAAYLTKNAFGEPIIVPCLYPENVVGPMFGGTYAATSDSRFHDAVHIYGAVPIHDRFETWNEYERMSR